MKTLAYDVRCDLHGQTLASITEFLCEDKQESLRNAGVVVVYTSPMPGGLYYQRKVHLRGACHDEYKAWAVRGEQNKAKIYSDGDLSLINTTNDKNTISIGMTASREDAPWVIHSTIKHLWFEVAKEGTEDVDSYGLVFCLNDIFDHLNTP